MMKEKTKVLEVYKRIVANIFRNAKSTDVDITPDIKDNSVKIGNGVLTDDRHRPHDTSQNYIIEECTDFSDRDTKDVSPGALAISHDIDQNMIREYDTMNNTTYKPTQQEIDDDDYILVAPGLYEQNFRKW